MKTATQLKFVGLQSAASHYAVDLAKAKRLAILLGLQSDGNAVVSSDEVRDLFLLKEGRPLEIGNAIGKLFDKKRWVLFGRKPSKRPQSHARVICTWMLKKNDVLKAGDHVTFAVGTDNGVRFCHKCFQEVKDGEDCACPKL